MKTKPIAFLAFAALSPFCLSQVGPPPGKRPLAGPVPVSMESRPTAVGAPRAETIRILSSNRVQNELGLSLNQWTSLNALARSQRGRTVAEDQTMNAVSNILTEAQTKRLLELLITDLGYGALTFSAIRSQLSLTREQETLAATLVSALETTKAALASASDQSMAQKALNELRTSTYDSLAKLLSADQDAKLRSFAAKN